MLPELIKQELRTMEKEVCPRCGGELRAIKHISPGFGGYSLLWHCTNFDCDQYDIGKTHTQIAVGYIKEVEKE